MKKLLFWVLLLVVAYYGADYVKLHTSGDVVAYKRFAKALLQQNAYIARQASSAELAAKAFSRQSERMKPYAGTRLLFSYYVIVRQNLAKDGNKSILVVDQVSRVTSNGQTGIWGDREIRTRHTVQVEKKEQSWGVTDFIDPAML